MFWTTFLPEFNCLINFNTFWKGMSWSQSRMPCGLHRLVFRTNTGYKVSSSSGWSICTFCFTCKNILKMTNAFELFNSHDTNLPELIVYVDWAAAALLTFVINAVKRVALTRQGIRGRTLLLSSAQANSASAWFYLCIKIINNQFY